MPSISGFYDKAKEAVQDYQEAVHAMHEGLVAKYGSNQKVIGVASLIAFALGVYYFSHIHQLSHIDFRGVASEGTAAFLGTSYTMIAIGGVRHILNLRRAEAAQGQEVELDELN